MKKIWLDTDPGVDDLIALAMLVGAKNIIEVIGVSTVFGNISIDGITRNAKLLLEAAGLADLALARGASEPLSVPLATAPFVHGSNGMGDMPLSEPRMPESPLSAPQAIIKAIRSYPNEVTVLAIGPLTNLAMAVQLAPEISGMVKEVVIMGGAVFCPGNATPAAEANFYYDPHAARIVMRAGWPIVLAPLDVVNDGLVPQVLLDKICASKRPLTKYIAGALPFYQRFSESCGMVGEVDFPDALAAAYVIASELFVTETIPLYVEVDGGCRGQSVPVRRGNWFEEKDDPRSKAMNRNVAPSKVMLRADHEKFLALVEKLLI